MKLTNVPLLSDGDELPVAAEGCVLQLLTVFSLTCELDSAVLELNMRLGSVFE